MNREPMAETAVDQLADEITRAAVHWYAGQPEGLARAEHILARTRYMREGETEMNREPDALWEQALEHGQPAPVTQDDLFKAMCQAADGYVDGEITGDELHDAVVTYTDACQLARKLEDTP